MYRERKVMSNSNQNGVQANARAHSQNTNPPTPEDLKDSIAKMDSRLERLLKYAYVLMNLDYYFQGIILTAVSQVSSPKCHPHCFLFSALSLVPFSLNVVPLIHVASKYVRVKNERDLYKLLLERNRDKHNNQQQQQVHEDKYRKCVYNSGLVVAVVLWFGFHGMVLYVCYSLLCRDDPVRPIVDYDGNCFSACDDSNQKKCLRICTV